MDTVPEQLQLSIKLKLVICLSVAAVSLLLHKVHIIEAIESRLYDFRIRLSASEEIPSDDIVVIGIDDRSMTILESQIGRWPWPRYIYDGIIDYCSEAKAIAFDIILSEQDLINEGSDSLLAESVNKYGKVISALHLSEDVIDTLVPSQQAEDFSLSENFAKKKRLHSYNSSLFPYPELLQSTKYIGHINQELDSDNVIRSYVLASHFQGKIYPSLALATAIQYLDIDLKSLAIDQNNYLSLGNNILRLEDQCKLRFIPTKTLPKTYSAFDILKSWQLENSNKKTTITREEFEGKIVLIGSLAAGLQKDKEVTAGGQSLDGIYITSMALNNMINGRYLTLSPMPYNVLIIVLLSFIPLLPNLRKPRMMVIVILIVVIGFGLTVLYFQLGLKIILPVTSPVLALLSSSISLGIAYWYTEMMHSSKLEFNLQEAYDDLKISNEKLEEYSKTLEIKVDERTQELKEKNTKLEVTLQQVKEMQNQLIMQEKLASLGQVTAGIAHEIKNPLNFVNNFSTLSISLAEELNEILANDKINLDPKIIEDVDLILKDIMSNSNKIHEHGIRANNIVQGMLLQYQGKNDDKTDTDINRLVGESINVVYQSEMVKDQSFNIEIAKFFDPDLKFAMVISHTLSRALINLLNNAFYAVREKMKKNANDYVPTIKVFTKKLEHSIEIKIYDNGVGIPSEIKSDIFNPFFTTKPTGTGTGLGLSVCFDIVTKVHKGALTVNSDEGKFTEIKITLPV